MADDATHRRKRRMSFVMGVSFTIFVVGIALSADLLTAFGLGALLTATLGRNWDH